MAHVCRWMVSAVQRTLNKQKKKREERGEDSGDGSMEEAGKDLCHSAPPTFNPKPIPARRWDEGQQEFSQGTEQCKTTGRRQDSPQICKDFISKSPLDLIFQVFFLSSQL